MENRNSSSALGEFIKSRRYRFQPEEAGIKSFLGRRRTPGLRREEVAYLANSSPLGHMSYFRAIPLRSY